MALYRDIEMGSQAEKRKQLTLLVARKAMEEDLTRGVRISHVDQVGRTLQECTEA